MMKLFFLRDNATKLRFIHPTGDHVFQPVYGLRFGHVGACCFTEIQTEAFLLKWEGEEIERVEVGSITTRKV